MTERYRRPKLVYEKMILKMKYEENLFFSKSVRVALDCWLSQTDNKRVWEKTLCVPIANVRKKERKVPEMVNESIQSSLRWKFFFLFWHMVGEGISFPFMASKFTAKWREISRRRKLQFLLIFIYSFLVAPEMKNIAHGLTRSRKCWSTRKSLTHVSWHKQWTLRRYHRFKNKNITPLIQFCATWR
jgi:hypothetical protein